MVNNCNCQCKYMQAPIQFEDILISYISHLFDSANWDVSIKSCTSQADQFDDPVSSEKYLWGDNLME